MTFIELLFVGLVAGAIYCTVFGFILVWVVESETDINLSLWLGFLFFLQVVTIIAVKVLLVVI
jgi:hypothetical protein